MFFRFPIFILSKIGLSFAIIQKLLFSSLLFISGFSFFSFIKYILQDKYVSAAAFLGANFYMFNLYSLQFFWHLLIILFIYAFLPIILLYCIKVFNKPNRKDFVLLTIFLLLSSPGINNLLIGLMLIVLVLFYLIIDFIFQVEGKGFKIFLKRRLFSLLLICLSFFLAWSHAVIPALYNIGKDINSATSAPTVNLEYIGDASFQKVAEGFRFMGHFGFFGSYKGDLYYPYSAIYKTPLFISLGFLIAILCYSSFFFYRRHKKNIIIFGFLTISSFLLINGPKSPIGAVYTFLFTRYPFFSMFRNPLDKIGLIFIFSFSVLLSISFSGIFRKINYTESKYEN
ncbi:TPA: hypothetical protein DCZ15_01265 [Candidatus Falkowbacteria bacterium]|nr:hypothetical protein [Candidatus Falkowbacteria bacterium]